MPGADDVIDIGVALHCGSGQHARHDGGLHTAQVEPAPCPIAGQEQIFVSTFVRRQTTPPRSRNREHVTLGGVDVGPEELGVEALAAYSVGGVDEKVPTELVGG